MHKRPWCLTCIRACFQRRVLKTDSVYSVVLHVLLSTGPKLVINCCHYISENCFDIVLRESELLNSNNIAILFTSLFQQDYGTLKSKPSLKKACFMNDIASSMKTASFVLVFSSMDKKCDGSLLGHVLQHFGYHLSSSPIGFVSNNFEIMLILKVVFQCTPLLAAAMPNKHFDLFLYYLF